jgi:hypothetical protein
MPPGMGGSKKKGEVLLRSGGFSCETLGLEPFCCCHFCSLG